jgi:hypothetical protein
MSGLENKLRLAIALTQVDYITQAAQSKGRLEWIVTRASIMLGL